jgi:phosphoglycerol transferase MdoB-like AlkP superfamily enzyme
MFNKLPNLSFIYVILFSLVSSLFLNLISKFFREKVIKTITIIFTFLISFFYIFNYLYFSLLSVPFSISTLELASQAMDFYAIGFHLIVTKLIDVLLLLIPFILYIIYINKFDYTKKSKKNIIITFLLTVCVYIVSILSLNLDKNTFYSAYNLYYNVDAMTTSNNVLGIFTTQRLSLKRNILGFNETILIDAEETDNLNEEISYNELDIDFDTLIENESDENIKNAYTYLKNNVVTTKNEYTGYYAGKNLIFILAEGFNSIAVDENLTPTLYKMINEGFNFTNYYSPVFLSTTGGEFQAMTSLIPTQEILGMWRNNSPYLPYSIGNAFSSIGYKAQSYHDWSYKYYGRNKTMPILGFSNYTACGNGLEEKINCTWLPSDVDLINATFSDYSSSTPFVTYYISVSGHAPYNFTGGNSIAIKNKKLVENLNYSDEVKAYLASQIELDNALNTLIEKLDEAGILDDTVIVLTGDHYPYTLTLDDINDVSSYERDDVIEVNHSNLIIWNNKEENVVIDKVASQIDVLPTILNLFGIEYDSRLLLGNDIFSDAEGVAIFSNRSWITNKGRFITNQGFTKTSDVDIDDDYVDTINNRVSNSFTISKLILEYDLYRKILNS